jgi:hypothetical protein
MYRLIWQIFVIYRISGDQLFCAPCYPYVAAPNVLFSLARCATTLNEHCFNLGTIRFASPLNSPRSLFEPLSRLRNTQVLA